MKRPTVKSNLTLRSVKRWFLGAVAVVFLLFAAELIYVRFDAYGTRVDKFFSDRDRYFDRAQVRGETNLTRELFQDVLDMTAFLRHTADFLFAISTFEAVLIAYLLYTQLRQSREKSRGSEDSSRTQHPTMLSGP